MWHHHSQLCQHPRRQPQLPVVPVVQLTKQPPVLQPEQPTSLQPPRHASDAAEGPWLERPLAILSPKRARLASCSSGRGGPSAESSCSAIDSRNKFTAAAIQSQSDHRTRVQCRMWICSEMLMLLWTYFFKPSTTASVTDAVQIQLDFRQKKTTDVQISHRNGIKTSSDHQPHFLPNCLMMVACERSALYHDRRTQGHATPKAML